MRNYKKEYANNKKNYERFNIAIDKPLGINLKRKLQFNKLSIAEWFSKKAKEYVERGE